MAAYPALPHLYEPLDIDSCEIRILCLLPSSDQESAIVCRIELQSLNTVTSYNALSYCWGLEPEGPDIDVMGIKLSIKPNLFAALSHLRDKNETVRIWVDAICINQGDVAEREQQVSMMSRIYERAEVVFAWLGEEADGSADAMVLLQLLQKAIFEDKPRLVSLLRTGYTFLPAWRALIPLFQRPYWTRVWIVQEVLLSNNVMLCCGNHRVAWPTFCLLVTDLLPRFGAEHAASPTGQEDNPISNALHALEYLSYDVDKLSKLSLRYQQHLDKKGGSHGAPSDRFLDLLDCLTMSRWRWAKDERDHVHGILSIAAETTDIQPNYRDSTEEIFRQVTMRDIETRGALDILSGCKHFAPEERDSDNYPKHASGELRENHLLLQELRSGMAFTPLVEATNTLGHHPLWFEKVS